MIVEQPMTHRDATSGYLLFCSIFLTGECTSKTREVGGGGLCMKKIDRNQYRVLYFAEHADKFFKYFVLAARSLEKKKPRRSILQVGYC